MNKEINGILGRPVWIGDQFKFVGIIININLKFSMTVTEYTQ